MQADQQYFDRSRRPRGASAHASRALQAERLQVQPSPSVYTQETAQSGFNAYSVPVSPVTPNHSPYVSKGPDYPYQAGSSRQGFQDSGRTPNGSVAAPPSAALRGPVNGIAPRPYTANTGYQGNATVRQDSESQIELVSMKKGHYEEEDDGDEEYLDEIYQIIDAVVPRTDDPSLPSLTFRVWVLGMGFGILLAAGNTILSFRSNAMTVSPFITVLLAYPCGIFMAKVLPSGILNPGPFNYKEHALIFVMTNAMATTPYALSNIVGQRYQLYQELSLPACFAFAVVTQCFGYGFAGITRRFLVRPAAMLWPSNFATIAMLNSLHVNDDISMGRYPMSRYEFFWLVTSAMFFYTFLPGYVAPMLGALSVICWFTKAVPHATGKVEKLAMVLGSSSYDAGVGFLSFSLDWSLFSVYAPITTPLWAMFNQMFGIYLFMWVIVPLCWWFDVFGDQKVGFDSIYGFALNSPSTYDRNGSLIDTKDFVMYSADNRSLVLNETFYHEHEPILISTSFAVNYLTSFIVFVSALVHVALWYGKDIWNRFRASLQDLDSDDIHAKLMDAYPDVPEWWYMALLVITLGGGIAVCQFGGFDLPWWGVLVAVILALVSMLPIGIIQAISGQQIGLNVMSEFLIGLILPNRIAAVMSFKTFSYMAMYQGLYLVQDMKLGHYIKIAPKAMFVSQTFSTLVGAIVSTATACVVYEAFGKDDDPSFPQGFQWRLQKQPPNSGWNSASYDTFLSAGAIWGAIGPARFFGPGSPYFKTLFGFAAGIVLPAIPWILHKLQPDSFWHLINIPLIVVMPTSLGSQQSTYITPMILAVIINYYVKKYRHMWWKKYAYVMSAAFDAGSGVTVLLIFFVTQFNQYYTLPFPTWFLNPGDVERCLPDDIIGCMSHMSMGNGFNKSYNIELDSDLCQTIN
ncbi:OPT oligopeptide transporter protein-domain-containing protein [Obelidium mucronatum]|nr:OPT oligopeptide transporter protein-domain-containing protein [Obelidium mucronatum]